MNTLAFTISINGGSPVTLASLGVESLSMETRALGATPASDDALNFVFALGCADARPFAFMDEVELFDSNGDRRFIGRARSAIPDGSADTQRINQQVWSPSIWLASVYKDNRNILDTTSLIYSQQLSCNVLLNRAPSVTGGGLIPELSQITIKAQVERILDYAILTGFAGNPAPFTYDTTGVPEIYVQQDSAESITCAAALERALAQCPGVTKYWDMTGVGDPVLRFVNMTAVNTATGSLISPPTLTGSGTPTTHAVTFGDGTEIVSAQPVPHEETMLSTLQLEFFYTTEDLTSRASTDGNVSDRPRPSRQILIYLAESYVPNGSPLTTCVPIHLAGNIWNGAAWANPESMTEEQMDTMARLIHSGYAARWWSFNLESRKVAGGNTADFFWERRPGDLMTLDGMGIEANCTAVIQSISRTLAGPGAGTVSTQTGPPTMRGLSVLGPRRHRSAPPPSNSTGGGAGPATWDFEPTEPIDGTTPDPSSPDDTLAINPISNTFDLNAFNVVAAPQTINLGPAVIKTDSYGRFGLDTAWSGYTGDLQDGSGNTLHFTNGVVTSIN